jgi:hypothetical protein
VEKAIERKTIVRTWAMRGTLQFVAAKDYRWIHDLIAPRFRGTDSARNRQLGLDAGVFRKSNRHITGALRREKIMTRDEIGALLRSAGIDPRENRLSHLLHFATMHQLICYGPRRGKEITFVLLDEWIPSMRTMTREEAMAELAKRYFISRGPATLRDFVWWSGLSLREARQGLEGVSRFLTATEIEGNVYWSPGHSLAGTRTPARVRLLAGFDEMLIAYADRSAMLDETIRHRAIYSNGVFHPVILIDGTAAGIWRPMIKGRSVIMRSELFGSPSAADRQAIEKAFERYRRFAGFKNETAQR